MRRNSRARGSNSNPGSSVALILVLALAAMGCGPKADVVYKNGTIYTVDAGFTQAEAVATTGNRIVFVGSNADADGWIGDKTRVIDLQGKTMVPGFIDSHYHFMGVGQRKFTLNLDGTKSLQEFLSKVAAEVANRQPGEWVTGRGWIEEDWPSKRFPTRQDLDKVAPNNPIYLTRTDGHAAVVNSQAIQIAGINRQTADPQGGNIQRDRGGVATGMLIDRAMGLVARHIPSDETPEVGRKFAKAANDEALAYGITQVHDMGSSWQLVDLWKEMYANGEMDVRIHAYIRGPGDDTERLLTEGAQIGLYDHHLTVRGIKISQDGALGSRGAALLQPYSDAPTSGLLIYKDEQIYPTIKQALQNGIQMAIHAIGDRANRNILDLFEHAFDEVPPASRAIAEPRFRIEHAQIVHPMDIPRFKSLNVIPSMQPSHAIGDLHFAVRRLGLDRMQGAYAWRSFIDQSNFIPGGSDAPVEEGNPMIEYYAACVRKDTTGFAAEGWHPEQKMTREEALRSLTIWGARAVFEEDLLGSIETGKLADFTVLDRDLMTTPENELFRIQVLMTVVGGKIVYGSEESLATMP